MPGDLEESIKKFETKKEFVAVKLKTRQSFREDQVALERRLSKYREKPARKMSDGTPEARTNCHVNGHSEDIGCEGEINSKLESIVMDLSKENELQRTPTKCAGNKLQFENGTIIGKHSVKSPGANDTVVINNEVSDKTSTLDGQINLAYQRSTSDIRQGEVNERNNDCVTDNNMKPNAGHSELNVLSNGSATNENRQPYNQMRDNLGTSDNVHQHQPVLEHSSLIMRPKVAGHARSSMTPEPRMKVAKGIYQKNPRLTGASTEHLDNISVKGQIFGHRFQDKSRTVVTQIPAAEVTSLPADGNLCSLNVPQMVTVFRLLNVPDELVVRLSSCNVDGRRFAAFSDKELDDLRMNNPVVRYFRDRSAVVRQRRKKLFIL